MAYIYGGLALFLVQLLIGAAIVFSGSVSIAADQPHSAPVQWLLDTAKDRSIRQHAKDIAPPAARPADQQAGLRAYQAMCLVCHGAPGTEPGLIGQGLRPRAPDLAETARRRSASELFWVTRHGIKFTGMPAWGETHNDEQLWEVVSFVERLGSLSEAEYRALLGDTGTATDGHSHHHDPDSGS